MLLLGRGVKISYSEPTSVTFRLTQSIRYLKRNEEPTSLTDSQLTANRSDGRYNKSVHKFWELEILFQTLTTHYFFYSILYSYHNKKFHPMPSDIHLCYSSSFHQDDHAQPGGPGLDYGVLP